MMMDRRKFFASIGGLVGNIGSSLLFWRNSYPYTIVEIKCWIQVDEKRGYELIPMIKLNNSNWFYVISNDNPLKLDNRFDYVIEAPEEYQGGKFVSWQSEKTGMIIPSRELVLKGGFESDTWWQNYVVR
jgi:hypothetical protein